VARAAAAEYEEGQQQESDALIHTVSLDARLGIG
jgi:hypothetical protein